MSSYTISVQVRILIPRRDLVTYTTRVTPEFFDDMASLPDAGTGWDYVIEELHRRMMPWFVSAAETNSCKVTYRIRPDAYPDDPYGEGLSFEEDG